MSYFKKIIGFLVYFIRFHKAVHNKFCLDKAVGQINDLERGGFVPQGQNYV